MRTAVVSSLNRKEEVEAVASLILRPPIGQFGLVEFDAYAKIIETGYVHAKEVVAAWPPDTLRSAAFLDDSRRFRTLDNEGLVQAWKIGDTGTSVELEDPVELRRDAGARLRNNVVLTPHDGEFAASDELAFAHPLIQEVTYAMILSSTRREHHQRVAEVMERTVPPDRAGRAGMLAYHFSLGTDPEKAE